MLHKNAYYKRKTGEVGLMFRVYLFIEWVNVTDVLVFELNKSCIPRTIISEAFQSLYLIIY